MAITQDRMIAILNAAQDYEQALGKAIGLIQKHAKEAHDGIITWQEAMEATYLMVSVGGLLTRAATTNKTLGAERQHFKAFARRNERAAQRAAEKRGPTQRPQRQNKGVPQDYIEFVPEHSTAPKTIQKEGRLYGSILDDVDAMQKEKYAPDPSLEEDDEFVPPEVNAEAQGLGQHSTLDAETRQRIEREAEAAVKSHPGTVGEDKEDSGDENEVKNS
jgi:hypothetical protein